MAGGDRVGGRGGRRLGESITAGVGDLVALNDLSNELDLSVVEKLRAMKVAPEALTMVLYEGKLIAFGPSAEVFARVRNAGGKGLPGSPQSPPQAKAEPRAAIAESVSS